MCREKSDIPQSWDGLRLATRRSHSFCPAVLLVMGVSLSVLLSVATTWAAGGGKRTDLAGFIHENLSAYERSGVLSRPININVAAAGRYAQTYRLALENAVKLGFVPPAEEGEPNVYIIAFGDGTDVGLTAKSLGLDSTLQGLLQYEVSQAKDAHGAEKCRFVMHPPDKQHLFENMEVLVPDSASEQENGFCVLESYFEASGLFVPWVAYNGATDPQEAADLERQYMTSFRGCLKEHETITSLEKCINSEMNK